MFETSSSPSNESQIVHQTEVAEELILIDQIQSLPYAVRETKEEDYEKLCQSIKEGGLLQPFVVAQPLESEHYVLIAGDNTLLEIVQRLH